MKGWAFQGPRLALNTCCVPPVAWAGANGLQDNVELLGAHPSQRWALGGGGLGCWAPQPWSGSKQAHRARVTWESRCTPLSLSLCISEMHTTAPFHGAVRRVT